MEKQIEIPSGVKGLIFDLDGTLVDSMPVHKVAWKEVCSAEGFDFTDEIFYKYAGVPSEKILELINDEFGTNFNPLIHSKLKEDAYEVHINKVKPIEIALNLVKKYHGVLPLGVGTGGPRSHSIKVLETLNLSTYFDAIVTKDNVKNGKPDPETFLLCAEKLNVPPSDCLVLEDGDMGIEAAKSAGMTFVDIRKYL